MIGDAMTKQITAHVSNFQVKDYLKLGAVQEIKVNENNKTHYFYFDYDNNLLKVTQKKIAHNRLSDIVK